MGDFEVLELITRFVSEEFSELDTADHCVHQAMALCWGRALFELRSPLDRCLGCFLGRM